MFLFVFTFFAADVVSRLGSPNPTRLRPQEWVLVAGLALLTLGLAAAWIWEGWGGLISVAGFALMATQAPRQISAVLPFLAMTAVGVLHILCWWRLRGPRQAAEPVPEAKRALRKVHASGWPMLGVFVLLCANEMFGQPPWMAGSKPPADIVGTWSATLTALRGEQLSDEIRVSYTIDPDGSVSGSIGETTLAGARSFHNRSWFGHLLHWRTDYRIRGSLSSAIELPGEAEADLFSNLLTREGGGMRGEITLLHPGPARTFRLMLKRN